MSWRALPLALAAALAGCYGSPTEHLWFACSNDAECGEGGLRCDDGVCCRPGGTPACPTMVPESNVCPGGGPPQLYYEDLDGDGFGNEARSLVLCAAPAQRAMVTQPGDCNDNPAAGGAGFNPGRADVCDGSDNNCNGVFNDPPCANFYWADADADGYGDPAAPLGESAGAPPAGAVPNPSDCAPANSAIHPAAGELCNGLDDNCNGIPDDGAGTIRRFYRDADGDGFGDAADFMLACAAPPGHVADNTDCSDRRANAFPGNFDVCDGVDNDCVGGVDTAPFCGGPNDLFETQSGLLRVGAQNNRVDGGSFRGCRRTGTSTNPVNPVAEAFNPPSWSGTGLREHVAWVETTSRWDLSKPGRVFRMDFTVTGTGLAASKPFYTTTFQRQPLIVFCDRDGNSNGYVNLEQTSGDGIPLIETLGTAYSIRIPIGGSPVNAADPKNKWLLIPRGLDLKNVHWVELVAEPNDVGATAGATFTFNITRLGFE